jgi:hypothetical protein
MTFKNNHKKLSLELTNGSYFPVSMRIIESYSSISPFVFSITRNKVFIMFQNQVLYNQSHLILFLWYYNLHVN